MTCGAIQQELEVVFMLEEETAKIVLEEIMPKVFSNNPEIKCRYISHSGRSDLAKSIPRKLKVWTNPSARFVIMHDQDAHDCRHLKKILREKCEKTNHPNALIRIVCRELEAWYWGDLDAVSTAYPLFDPKSVQNKKQYRAPDSIDKPAIKLQSALQEKRVPKSDCGKILMAKKISKHMSISRNISPSFRNFIKGIQKLTGCKCSYSEGLFPELL